MNRAAAFRFPSDRDRFVMTRGALRMVLARYVDRDARHLCFAYDANKKPALVLETSHEPVRFNVSHSADLALVAVALRRAVGIDVERIRRDIEIDGIARGFAPGELNTLQRLSGEARIRAFFACWTRKEAYLKAQGTGLARRLDEFEVSLTPGAPAALLVDRADSGNVEQWCLRDLSPAPDYAAALAVEGHGWQLACWQWEVPSLGTAVKHRLGNPSPPRPRKGTIMDCEPDRDRQEGAPPASNTSLRPSTSAPYRESEDWTLLRQLIKHRAPVVIDIEEPTE